MKRRYEILSDFSVSWRTEEGVYHLANYILILHLAIVIFSNKKNRLKSKGR